MIAISVPDPPSSILYRQRSVFSPPATSRDRVDGEFSSNLNVSAQAQRSKVAPSSKQQDRPYAQT